MNDTSCNGAVGAAEVRGNFKQGAPEVGNCVANHESDHIFGKAMAFEPGNVISTLGTEFTAGSRIRMGAKM